MKTLLVVDDSPDVLELLEVLLKGAGYDVLLADHPVKALELLEHRVPDAIILDIMMPMRSGIEVLENIRWNPKLAGLPVLVLTAATLSAQEKAFLRDFTVGYMDKTEMPNVVERVNQFLADTDARSAPDEAS